MSYIGAQPTTASFPFDQFSGDGSTTAFTLTYAPASPTSIIVAISGVVQNPNLYSVIGTTITFSPAPPTGTNNISVLYLGLPVIGVSSPGNTAYFSSTSFTATGGQTMFTPSGSYQVGFINVIRNGSQLAPADYTATNGTTVVLNNACTAGDIVVIEVYTLTSISNALPLTGGTVTGATTFNSNVTVNGALASGYTGMKNRIINGGMVIDQRNAGASVTINTASFSYAVDRFFSGGQSSDGVFTVQRSTVAPSGFTNSLLATVTTADASLGATQRYLVGQLVEGFNIADLGFGTASAQSITLSFWVRSSVTGVFGGCVLNSGFNRSYPFTYTINAANTFEYKTVTIAGDTSGTWVTDNGVGLRLYFSLGSGSTDSGTAGAWSGSFFSSATGSTNLMATSGATFYLTGVQLERGSNATSFEFRDYGRELAMCQRYYWQLDGNNAPYSITGINGGTDAITTLYNPVVMRAAPTSTFASGSFESWSFSSAGGSQASNNVAQGSVTVNFNSSIIGCRFYYSKYGQGGLVMWNDMGGQTFKFTFSSEL
jgi:hypothetical protein